MSRSSFSPPLPPVTDRVRTRQAYGSSHRRHRRRQRRRITCRDHCPVPQRSALQRARRIIETPKLKGSINLEGARIDDLVLLAHRTALPKDSPPVRLFSPSGTKTAHFARFGWTGTGITAPDDKTVWTPSAGKLTPSNAGHAFLDQCREPEVRYYLSRSTPTIMITAEQRFTNGGTAVAQVAPFGLISAARGCHPTSGSHGISMSARWACLTIIPLPIINYDDVDEAPNGTVSYNSTGGWLGETEMYWLAALIPDQKTRIKASFKSDGGYYWSQDGQRQ